MPLSLRERGWARDGQTFGTGSPFHYDVIGMPPGEEAMIANFPVQGWKILKIKDGVTTQSWAGEYATVDDALNALRAEL